MSQTQLPDTLHAAIVEQLSRLDAYAARKGRAKSDLVTELHTDPVYSIFGLDCPEYVEAAMSGGILTSIHRKIGDLYERCVQMIVAHQLSLPPGALRLAVPIRSGDVEESRSVDVHIPFDRVESVQRDGLEDVARREVLAVTANPAFRAVGMSLEVRHCYQSADSKRAQADEAMARYLLLSGFLPVMLVFCSQSNRQVMARYRGTWLVKEGAEAYRFLQEITGFRFYDFLLARKEEYRAIVQRALQRLRG